MITKCMLRVGGGNQHQPPAGVMNSSAFTFMGTDSNCGSEFSDSGSSSSMSDGDPAAVGRHTRGSATTTGVAVAAATAAAGNNNAVMTILMETDGIEEGGETR